MAEFVRLAQGQLGSGLVAVTSDLDYRELTPADSVIIIAPDGPLDGASLTSFLADGGRLAILDDFGTSSDFLSRFGIRRVSAPLAPARMLRDDPDLPIATPVVQSAEGALEGRHPMTLGVSEVVTNHPRGLEHPDLTPVLQIAGKDGSITTVAITGIISGKGRLLVVADPSMFINLMLRYPGNRAFAHGLFDYLSERDDASGGTSAPSATAGQMIIVSGRFGQVGRYGQANDVQAEILGALSAARDALLEVETEGLPRALLLALAALVAFWVLSRELPRSLPVGLSLVPGYARPGSLLAQPGPSSRLEVLRARSTNPSLALLELDAALRESLSLRLGVNPALGPSELRETLRSHLTDADTDAITSLLGEARAWGARLGQGSRARPSTRQLERLHEEVMRLQRVVEQAQHRVASRDRTEQNS